MSQGRMVVIITTAETQFTPIQVSGNIKQELPADRLGEILCDAVHTAWKSGADPVDMQVSVHFYK